MADHFDAIGWFKDPPEIPRSYADPGPMDPTDVVEPSSAPEKLTKDIIEDWTIGTLQGWLDDYTTSQDGEPLQYRARLQDDGTFLFTPLNSSAHPQWAERGPQRFRISVDVEEVPAEDRPAKVPQAAAQPQECPFGCLQCEDIADHISAGELPGTSRKPCTYCHDCTPSLAAADDATWD